MKQWFGVVLLLVVCVGMGHPLSAYAATLLSNISQSNDKGTSIFRSNIWVAYRLTAGSPATIDSVTLNLDPTAGNYTGFSTYTSGVIRFYNDNSGVVGSAIPGTLAYTSTNSGTGHTVYANASGTITIPSAGNYWIALTCSACANIDYRESSSASYSGATDWQTIIGSASISTSNNKGSSWGTPYSSSTYGAVMMTIAGTETDNTAPTASTLAPADDATGVALDTNLVITFDEAVDAESGNFTIKMSANDSTVETIDVTSDKVTGSGSTEITIDPATTLTGSTDYYVNIDATAFDDAAGNSYAGMNSATAWNFTTVVVPTPAPSTSENTEQNTVTNKTFVNVITEGNDEGGPIPLKPVITSDNQVIHSKETNTTQQQEVKEGSNTAITSKIPDADQVQQVYVKIAGKKVPLKVKDDTFTFTITLGSDLPPGRHPYILTADYGIFALRQQGELIVNAPEQPTPAELIAQQGDIFSKVFDRNASSEEGQYWTKRILAGEKKTAPELYGAMQWQRIHRAIAVVPAVAGMFTSSAMTTWLSPVTD